MAVYNILEARNQLSRLVAAAEAGEEVTIARRGEPVVRMVRLDPPGPASGAAIVAWLGEHPARPGLGRSADEIDAAIEMAREGWE
ncbi:type II toxin-antitoxin system prevent-host-death family antitoxin [Miniimonas arenae]|uniref:Antitoxin n=1 Tax=Miniimonas arenae TaxID=676201 RepID=A0A5C5BCM5_9MICO|nr:MULTISPECIES: type II toxin-antitoxin system prevent-host-death family antitoxin [Miniimonas]TNU73626.1 type II toxin-antitoxin system prevent-host-death family antitoxin [Miniimonas arenae]